MENNNDKLKKLYSLYGKTGLPAPAAYAEWETRMANDAKFAQAEYEVLSQKLKLPEFDRFIEPFAPLKKKDLSGPPSGEDSQGTVTTTSEEEISGPIDVRSMAAPAAGEQPTEVDVQIQQEREKLKQTGQLPLEREDLGFDDWLPQLGRQKKGEVGMIPAPPMDPQIEAMLKGIPAKDALDILKTPEKKKELFPDLSPEQEDYLKRKEQYYADVEKMKEQFPVVSDQATMEYINRNRLLAKSNEMTAKEFYNFKNIEIGEEFLRPEFKQEFDLLNEVMIQQEAYMNFLKNPEMYGDTSPEDQERRLQGFGQKLLQDREALAEYRKNAAQQIDQNINALKAQLVKDPDNAEEIKSQIKILEGSKAFFINPEKAAAQAIEDAAPDMGRVKSPEQFKEIYNAWYAERNDLLKELGIKPEGWNREVILQRDKKDLLNMLGVEDNPKYDRLIELEKKLAALAPAALLNKLPTVEGDSGFGTSFMSAFNKTLRPLAGESYTEDDIAQTTMQVVSDLGIPVSQEAGAAAEEAAQPAEFGSAGYWGQTLGTTAGIMVPFIATSALTGGVGNIGRVKKIASSIDDLISLAQYTKGGRILYPGLKLAQRGVAEGAKFELTGEIFGGSDIVAEEANFAVGFFGGVLGGATEKVLEKMAPAVVGVLGAENVPQFVKATEKFGRVVKAAGNLNAQGITEAAEEYGNEIGAIYRESETWADAKKLLEDRFGTFDKNMEFFVTTYVMGAGMGAPSAIGRWSNYKAKDIYDNLPEEDKAKADEVVEYIDKQLEKPTPEAKEEGVEVVEPTSEEEEAENIVSSFKKEQDDSKDEQGVSGEERKGQEPVETQPIEGAGTEEAGTGGDVQSDEEVDQPEEAPEPETIIDEAAEEEAALQAEYDTIEAEVRGYDAEQEDKLTEDEIDDVTAAIQYSREQGEDIDVPTIVERVRKANEELGAQATSDAKGLGIDSDQTTAFNKALRATGMKGGIFSPTQRKQYQGLIERNYVDPANIDEQFDPTRNDLRQGVWNYDNPIAQKEVNGKDVRIAPGIPEGDEKTYLLYVDGDLSGKFYSVDDAKKVVGFIENNLTTPEAIEEGAQKETQPEVEAQPETKPEGAAREEKESKVAPASIDIPEAENISPEVEKDREAGVRKVGGATYERRPELAETDQVEGNTGKSTFKPGEATGIPFTYTLSTVERIEPTHKGATRNQASFIPESQPKDRGKEDDLENQQRAEAFENEQIGPSGVDPFKGFVNINQRGEVFQGTGRWNILNYNKDRQGRIEYLKSIADQTGISAEQIDAFAAANPNSKIDIFRKYDVTDNQAIRLGNYGAQESESTPKGTERKQAVAKVSKAAKEKTINILRKAVKEGEYKTGREVITDKAGAILSMFQKEGSLTPTEYSKKLRGGEVSTEGMDWVQKVVMDLILPGSERNIDNLSDAAVKGIEKSIPYILSVADDKTITNTIANSIGAAADYKNSGVLGYENWKNSARSDQKRLPIERFTALELEIARRLSEDTENKIAAAFRVYYDATEGSNSLFGQVPPMTREDASTEAFGVEWSDPALLDVERISTGESEKERQDARKSKKSKLSALKKKKESKVTPTEPVMPEDKESKEEIEKSYGSDKEYRQSIKTASDIASDQGKRVAREVRGSTEEIRGRTNIVETFEREGGIGVVGTQVLSPVEVAELFSFTRNPYIEKATAVFMKGKEVVGYTVSTLGKIDSASIIVTPDQVEEYKKRGADGIYLIHNHPSGNPTPSEYDINSIKEYDAEGLSLLGGIVLNGNRFSLIKKSGSVETKSYNSPELFTPGTQMNNSEDYARLAKHIGVNSPMSIVWLDTQGNIMDWSEIPALEGKELTKYLRGLYKERGGAMSVIVGNPMKVNSAFQGAKVPKGTEIILDPETGKPYSPTGIVQKGVALPSSEAQIEFKEERLLHGSPFDIENFSVEKINSGRGAQAYGWGLYFTDSREVASSYANKIQGFKNKKGEKLTGDYIESELYSEESIKNIFQKARRKWLQSTGKYNSRHPLHDLYAYVFRMGYSLEEGLENTRQVWEQKRKDTSGKEKLFVEEMIKDISYLESISSEVDYLEQGGIYEVIIHKGRQPSEYDYLDWNKPLSESQANKVLSGAQNIYGYGLRGVAIKAAIKKLDKLNGGKVYRAIQAILGGQKKASLFLLDSGIDGIKYYASEAPSSANPKTNYVIFDDRAVTIEKKPNKEMRVGFKEERQENREEIEEVKDIIRDDIVSGDATSLRTMIKSFIAEELDDFIPTLIEAYKEFKTDMNLSVQVRNSLDTYEKINSYDIEEIRSEYEQQEQRRIAEQAAAQRRTEELTALNTQSRPIYSSRDGADADGGSERPPLRYASSRRNPVYGSNVVKEIVGPGQYKSIDEHQRYGVNMALTAFRRGQTGFLLGDGTGVGKSIESLVMAMEMYKITGKPSLIVTVNQTVINDNFKAKAGAQLLGMSSIPGVRFATYDTLRTEGMDFDTEYGAVIFDEAHKMKNRNSLTAMAASKLKSGFNVYGTATPMDKPEHSHYFISSIMGMTDAEVEDRLGYEIQYVEVKDPQGGVDVGMEAIITDKPAYFNNLIQLRDEMIERGLMIRREYPFYGTVREDVMPVSDATKADLDKIDAYWFKKEQNLRYAASKNKWSKDYLDKKLRDARRSKHREMSRISEAGKIDVVWSQIQSDIEAGRKSVVMLEVKADKVKVRGLGDVKVRDSSVEIETLAGKLMKKLKSSGVKYDILFGSNQKQKDAAVQKFNDNEVDVLVSTIASGSMGVDMDDVNGDAPRTMIIPTAPYSGQTIQQILGRVSRRNTKSPATGIMVYDNSDADKLRRKIVESKMANLQAVQDGVLESTQAYEEEYRKKPTEAAVPDMVQSEDNYFRVYNWPYGMKEVMKDLKVRGRYDENRKWYWNVPADKAEVVQSMIDQIKADSDVTQNLDDKIAQTRRELQAAIRSQMGTAQMGGLKGSGPVFVKMAKLAGLYLAKGTRKLSDYLADAAFYQIPGALLQMAKDAWNYMRTRKIKSPRKEAKEMFEGLDARDKVIFGKVAEQIVGESRDILDLRNNLKAYMAWIDKGSGVPASAKRIRPLFEAYQSMLLEQAAQSIADAQVYLKSISSGTGTQIAEKALKNAITRKRKPSKRIGDRISNITQSIDRPFRGLTAFFERPILRNYQVDRGDRLTLEKQAELLAGVQGQARLRAEKIRRQVAGTIDFNGQKSNKLSREERRLFEEFLFAKRSLDRLSKGRDTGNVGAKMAQDMMASVMNRLPDSRSMEEFEHRGQVFQKIMDDNLKELLAAGRIGQEQYDGIKEKNDFYATFSVVSSDFRTGTGASGAIASEESVIKSIKGIAKDISQDTGIAEINEELKKLTSGAIDLDQFYERSIDILDNALINNKIDQEQYSTAISELGTAGFQVSSILGAAEEILFKSAFIGARNKFMSKVADVAKIDVLKELAEIHTVEEGRKVRDYDIGAKKAVVYFDKGVKKVIVMDEIAADTLGALDFVQLSMVKKMLSKANTLLRSQVITLNPSYLIKNLVFYDLMTTLLFNKMGILMGLDTDKPIRNTAKNMLMLIPDMIAAGVESIAANTINVRDIDKGLSKLTGLDIKAGLDDYQRYMESPAYTKGIYGGEPVQAFSDQKAVTEKYAVWRWFQWAVQLIPTTTEQFQKLVAFRRMKRLAKQQNVSEAAMEDWLMKAHWEIRNQVGSPDFANLSMPLKQASLAFPMLASRVKGVTMNTRRILAAMTVPFDAVDKDKASKPVQKFLDRISYDDDVLSTKEKAQVLLQLSAFVSASIAYALAHYNDEGEEDESYKLVSPKVKEDNMLIKTGNQIMMEQQMYDEVTREYITVEVPMEDYVLIPMRGIPGVINSVVKETIRSMEMGNPDGFKRVVDKAVSEYSPLNITGETFEERLESFGSNFNPLVKGPMEVATNRNFYFHYDNINYFVYEKYNKMRNELKKGNLTIEDLEAEGVAPWQVGSPGVVSDASRETSEWLYRNAGIMVTAASINVLSRNFGMEERQFEKRFTGDAWNRTTRLKYKPYALDQDYILGNN